jgi:hypothetical protein
MPTTLYQNFTNWQLSLPYEEIIGGLHMEAKDAIRICEYLSFLYFLSTPCCAMLYSAILHSALFYLLYSTLFCSPALKHLTPYSPFPYLTQRNTATSV